MLKDVLASQVFNRASVLSETPTQIRQQLPLTTTPENHLQRPENSLLPAHDTGRGETAANSACGRVISGVSNIYY